VTTGGDQALEGLLARIRACRVCCDTPRSTPLPHLPRPVVRATVSARIAVCGQAPGTRVHASGVPFSDASGNRLREWMGVDSATFYDASRIAIVPMGFCFPGLDAKGSDRPPRRECAPTWRGELFAALPALELILAVGRFAIGWHVPERRGQSLRETVSDWRTVLDQARQGPAVLPLPHPS
jgi:uracil-DNA glycosylase